MKEYPIKRIGPWTVMVFRAEADSSDPRARWITKIDSGEVVDLFRMSWIEGRDNRALNMTILSLHISIFKNPQTKQP